MSATRSETDQLFFDIFTTAMEGGINYWASVDRYHLWLNGDVDQGEDYDGFSATIEDVEDDAPDLLLRTYVVNRDVIAAGYNRAITSHANRIHWSSGDRPPYVVTQESRENWDFDAGDADCIVQLGLFEEVRYG